LKIYGPDPERRKPTSVPAKPAQPSRSRSRRNRKSLTHDRGGDGPAATATCWPIRILVNLSAVVSERIGRADVTSKPCRPRNMEYKSHFGPRGETAANSQGPGPARRRSGRRFAHRAGEPEKAASGPVRLAATDRNSSPSARGRLAMTTGALRTGGALGKTWNVAHVKAPRTTTRPRGDRSEQPWWHERPAAER